MRILIADDHQIVRSRVCNYLRLWDAGVTCAEAVNGRQAIEVAVKFDPTLVIMDITMPVLGGIEAAIELKKIMPKVPILFFSMHDGQHLTSEVHRTGAQGFVVKQRAGQSLIPAIQALARGGTYFS